MAVNCGAIPRELGNEFFRVEEGRLLRRRRPERLLPALAGGTTLLDEIGEAPLDLQVKMLRVLQGGDLAGGAERPVNAEVRVIGVHQPGPPPGGTGAFREDLYFRLSVFVLVPRERIEDIRPLGALARAWEPDL